MSTGKDKTEQNATLEDELKVMNAWWFCSSYANEAVTVSHVLPTENFLWFLPLPPLSLK